MRTGIIALLLIAVPVFAQTTRVASDFELAQMQQQLARSHDFVSQLSGHLNLGDVRLMRNEPSLARAEYATAYDIAVHERLSARRASEMTRYATATSYAALAQAKLGGKQQAFELAEEALRYTSDSAKTWNLYASTMTLLRYPAKAASASRNAVAIAEREVAADPTLANRLDLAVYEYTLASALLDARRAGLRSAEPPSAARPPEFGRAQPGPTSVDILLGTDTAKPQYRNPGAPEAEHLLRDVIATLQSPAFDPLKRDVARREAFEVYSSARGDAASYIALLNHAQLRLGAFYESCGDIARARQQYDAVLATRTDDATALAAIARLSRSGEHFAEAFDANPFSPELIDDYRRYLATQRNERAEGSSTGARVRRVIIAMQRGERQSAKAALADLERQFPDNATLHALRHELDAPPAAAPGFLASGVTTAMPSAADLRTLLTILNDNNLTPAQRASLDAIVFTSSATFDDAQPASSANQTVFESGAMDDVRFRFSEPIAFSGSFAAHAPLRLTYRILGASGDALLLEPVKLETTR